MCTMVGPGTDRQWGTRTGAALGYAAKEGDCKGYRFLQMGGVKRADISDANA